MRVLVVEPGKQPEEREIDEMLADGVTPEEIEELLNGA